MSDKLDTEGLYSQSENDATCISAFIMPSLFSHSALAHWPKTAIIVVYAWERSYGNLRLSFGSVCPMLCHVFDGL